MCNALQCAAISEDYSASASDGDDAHAEQRRCHGAGMMEQKGLKWMDEHHQFVTVDGQRTPTIPATVDSFDPLLTQRLEVDATLLVC